MLINVRCDTFYKMKAYVQNVEMPCGAVENYSWAAARPQKREASSTCYNSYICYTANPALILRVRSG